MKTKKNFWLKCLVYRILGDILPLYLRSRISQGVDAQWPTDPLPIKSVLTASSRKYTETFKLARFFDFATSKSGGRRSQALQGFSFEGRQDTERFVIAQSVPLRPVQKLPEFECSTSRRRADSETGVLAIFCPFVFPSLKKGGS